MPNNNENDQPQRKKVIFFKRAYPDVVQNYFYTKDNKKFRTKDGHDFIVKEDVK